MKKLLIIIFTILLASQTLALFDGPKYYINITRADINGGNYDINHLTVQTIDANAVFANYFIARNYIDANFLMDGNFHRDVAVARNFFVGNDKLVIDSQGNLITDGTGKFGILDVTGAATINSANAAQNHLTLMGKDGAAFLTRGGSIAWNNGLIVGGYTYINGANRFIFATTPQAGWVDNGNAYIDFATGIFRTAGGFIADDDNAKFQFGEGLDAEIYYDGSKLIIDDTATQTISFEDNNLTTTGNLTVNDSNSNVNGIQKALFVGDDKFSVISDGNLSTIGDMDIGGSGTAKVYIQDGAGDYVNILNTTYGLEVYTSNNPRPAIHGANNDSGLTGEIGGVNYAVEGTVSNTGSAGYFSHTNSNTAEFGADNHAGYFTDGTRTFTIGNPANSFFTEIHTDSSYSGIYVTDVESEVFIADGANISGLGAAAIAVNSGDILTTDDISILADDYKFYLGAAQDASIFYDSADLVINPREVGSGDTYIVASEGATSNAEVAIRPIIEGTKAATGIGFRQWGGGTTQDFFIGATSIGDGAYTRFITHNANGQVEYSGASPSHTFILQKAAGGAAWGIIDAQLHNTTADSQTRMGYIGILGSVANPPTPTYMFFTADPTQNYSNAFMKIDSQNRLGLGLDGASERPDTVLHARQTADSLGFRLEGFDDLAASAFDIYWDSAGELFITSTSGTINFDDENLITDGNLTVDGNLFVGGKIKVAAVPLLLTPQAGMIEYNGHKFYITNNGKQKAIDRTSDVAVASVQVANTTNETTIWTGEMAADSLDAGNVFMFHADGNISSKSASDKVTIRVKVGGVTKLELEQAAKQLDNDNWHINANATQRTIGATGQRAMHMDLLIDELETNLVGIAQIDTTANMNVTITAQWNNADAANILNLFQGFMEYKN